MRRLYIKQKLFSIGEKFTVKDESGNDCYFIEGSFLEIPKNFSVINRTGKTVSHISKKFFSLLPKFFVEIDGKDVLTIEKEWTFFRSRYSIFGAGIEIQGDWWDMNFSVYQNGSHIAHVSQKWISWGDTYAVEIFEDTLEELIISIVVAIDCVKSDEAATS